MNTKALPECSGRTKKICIGAQSANVRYMISHFSLIMAQDFLSIFVKKKKNDAEDSIDYFLLSKTFKKFQCLPGT